jgi:hypothetical protein
MSIQSVPTAAVWTVVAAERSSPGVSLVSQSGTAAAAEIAATRDIGISATADRKAVADFAVPKKRAPAVLRVAAAALYIRVAAAELWATVEVAALRLAAVTAARSAVRARCSAQGP